MENENKEFSFEDELYDVAEYVDNMMNGTTSKYEPDFIEAKTEQEVALVRAMLQEIKVAHDHMRARIEHYGERLRSGQV
jgi:hypothetical protein